MKSRDGLAIGALPHLAMPSGRAVLRRAIRATLDRAADALPRQPSDATPGLAAQAMR
jgi:hypothetical protein